MNPNSLQDMLEISEMLANRGDYEKALACVEEANCVMGEWLKGKIYLDCSLQISNTFTFKYYPTMDMKSQHRDILNLAYSHLYNAALLLPGATDDVKLKLNNCIWSQIAKVENELSMIRVIPRDDDDFDVCKDDELHQQLQTEILIDDISQWRF